MEVLEDFESNLCSKTEVIGKVWEKKKNTMVDKKMKEYLNECR